MIVFYDLRHSLFDPFCARNHHIRMLDAGSQVALRHGHNRCFELFDYGFHRPSALANVAGFAAREADLIVQIHVNLGVQQFSQRQPIQRKQALDYEDLRWLERFRFAGSGVLSEVIDGKLHGFPISQPHNLPDEQLVLQSPRSIEVYLCALLQRKVREVAIVAVKLKHVGIQRTLRCLAKKLFPAPEGPAMPMRYIPADIPTIVALESSLHIAR